MHTDMNKQDMALRIRDGAGYIAALDQSGGSTPTALATYGISPTAYSSDSEMFALMHAMRSRIMTSPAFSSNQVLGAILFDRTMDAEIAGVSVPTYLWQERGIVPFVKIDEGLSPLVDGVQLMRPMPKLPALLARAVERGVYGTKARSVIHSANAIGISSIVDQQISVAEKVLKSGLVPILEPEVSVSSDDKSEAEIILRDKLLESLTRYFGSENIILKLTLPDTVNFYKDLSSIACVDRVVALSGGYSLKEACQKLALNDTMIASFSRALLDRLRVDQSDEEFDAALQDVSDQIYAASVKKIYA
ncbi:fructose-1,6-bisphosphate aldolase [Neokomagataea thailandica NBRC 106555]|uniref:fructose-bisphosphate aldolase n=1 Tax=Neokomagataea thailandica NBRC 106555 TaxID=1223520 RepID=A0ABQ0QMR2_9PROT|nr:fructose-1,6-bisphosphate aldolase [Neokomagataea thailandica NBRC 106555]